MKHCFKAAGREPCIVPEMMAISSIHVSDGRDSGKVEETKQTLVVFAPFTANFLKREAFEAAAFLCGSHSPDDCRANDAMPIVRQRLCLKFIKYLWFTP
jgi:hypothetical protein